MNIMNVDYSTKIPNNVNLAERPPGAARRWRAGIPASRLVERHGAGGLSRIADVYLRTAIRSIPRLGQVRLRAMPEYRWGILLAPQEENRKIPFGEHKGEPAWQEVPGDTAPCCAG
jgi:benzoyl-CoA 2,3-dioxygenase component B